jgi:formate hydrogenlyase subunit 6/NADH:ubiquinone oxidoreductase subunit I
MSSIGWFERWRLPRYDNLDQTRWGAVSVDAETCTGCSMCARICPAACLEMVDKKSTVLPPDKALCIMCGDCVAICESDAITCERNYAFSGMHKTIDAGPLALPRL